MEPGLSSPLPLILSLSKHAAARPSGSPHMGYCGRGSNKESSLARHSPSMIPSIRSGRKRRWKAITAFSGSVDVVAKPLQREEKAGVGPIRIDEIAGRAWKCQPPLCQRVPGEQLARIFLASRGDVGMADDVAAPYPVPLLDVGDQRDHRRHLLVGEGAVAELVARIDDLDPDAGRIDVGHPAPTGLAGMPGAVRLIHQPVDRAVLVDEIVGGDLRFGRGQPVERGLRRACRYNGARSSRRAASARRNSARAGR